MNTEITIHPKLQHLGLTTSNLDAMLDWYRKVLGMTVNARVGAPGGPRNGPSFSAAFVSNDEVHHRMVFFEFPGVAADPDKRHHARVQHIAFEYETLDDLLGTYIRLKGLEITPVMAADEGSQTSLYYTDPDGNSIELNINNYHNDWTATEHMRTAAASAGQPRRVFVDPEKMVAARKTGASAWDLHERAFAGEFAPEKPYDVRGML
ncbi:MAG TPA: VOC family protein [Candidatus Cybelea sp.]|nr:VOC family protein [Candidatus Cybelea sp.]